MKASKVAGKSGDREHLAENEARKVLILKQGV